MTSVTKRNTLWGRLGSAPIPRTTIKWLVEFFTQGQNGFLLVFAVVRHRMPSDVFSIIVGYQDEHLHNIIVQFVANFLSKIRKVIWLMPDFFLPKVCGHLGKTLLCQLISGLGVTR